MAQKPYENWLTTEQSEKLPSARELQMYRSHRRNILRWMWEEGKNPEADIGYAESTVKGRSYRLDKFYRWVWDIEGSYTETIQKSHANAYMKYLYPKQVTESHKSTFEKAIQCLFKRQQWDLDKDVTWDPAIHYNDSSMVTNREALSREERSKRREAVLDYGSIPHYNAITPEERSQWKTHLAQRYGKPKSEVTREDFQRANSWKWPSLIWTSMDAGLRPKEVGEAKTTWVDTQSGILRIPAKDSVKNNQPWNVGLRDRTVDILERWMDEREQYDKYEDNEKLWLTRYGNPYGSQSLNRRFQKLCDDAGINHSNRDLCWYSIRHSVGR